MGRELSVLCRCTPLCVCGVWWLPVCAETGVTGMGLWRGLRAVPTAAANVRIIGVLWHGFAAQGVVSSQK